MSTEHRTVPLVVIVDDDEAARRSLRWLLESVDLRVDDHCDGRSFLAAFSPDQPGCVVLDVRMPGMSGLEVQTELTRRGALTPVIIVTGHADVPMAIQGLQAGAFEFIEKPFNDQILLDRIQAAIAEDARRRGVAEQQRSVDARLATLTRREHEVMEDVVAGRSNRQIAERLALSVKTVESHRARMMAKMEVESIPALVTTVLSRRTEGKP